MDTTILWKQFTQIMIVIFYALRKGEIPVNFLSKCLFIFFIGSSVVIAATTPPKGKIKTIEIGAGSAIFIKMENHDTSICVAPNYNYYYVIHPDAIYGSGSMDRMLSLLLSAKVAGKKVSFTLNGCTSVGPYVRHLILH